MNLAVPSLVVPDVPAAVAYYRDVLGFEPVVELGGHPPQIAVVRKQAAVLLLQRGGRVTAGTGRRSGPPWDAVLLVDDVEAAHQELKVAGVQTLTEIGGQGIGWDSFEFVDCAGNLLCVGRAQAEFLEPPSPPPAAPLQGPLTRLRRARATRAERAHLREFAAFRERLGDRPDPYFMFFTSGLMHWALGAASFVPADVNLVLLGSALDADELRWLQTAQDRPFHHIRLAVDDVTAWEYLFATNRDGFGWLDIDCFVLQPGLFHELADIDPARSMNCVWSWDPGFGFRVANTHLLYINSGVARAVAERGLPASPGAYNWAGSPRHYPARTCFMRVPTDAERRLLLTQLPADQTGRPVFLEADYYNTLVVYQLVARALGYPIHQVRALARRCGTPTDAENTDPAHWPEDMSDELFHLFGVSYYRNYEFAPGIRALYLAADHILLENTAGVLPPRYAARRDAVAAELASVGLSPQAARERFRRHLIEARGLSEHAAARVLGAGVPDPGQASDAVPR